MGNARQFVGRRTALLADLVLLLPSSWSACAATETWTPIVSKIPRTVTKIPASGPETVTEVWEGRYLRDFDGSEIRTWEKVVPSSPRLARQGTFIDRSSRKAYRLDFPTKTAVLFRNDLPSLPDEFKEQAYMILRGLQLWSFQGIPCYLAPLEIRTVGRERFSGERCYSARYHLRLFRVLDRTVEGSDLTIRTLTELYELEVGRTPNPDEVGLPPGFVPEEGWCSACDQEP